MINRISRPTAIGLAGITIFAVIAGLYCLYGSRPNFPVSRAQIDKYASEHSRDELGARHEGSTVVCKAEPTGMQKKGEDVLLYANILCQEYYVKDNTAYKATGMRLAGYFTLDGSSKKTISSLHYLEQPIDYKNLNGLSKSKIKDAIKGGRQSAEDEADATALSILHTSSLKPEPLY